jgi:hypothetical protein
VGTDFGALRGSERAKPARASAFGATRSEARAAHHRRLARGVRPVPGSTTRVTIVASTECVVPEERPKPPGAVNRNKMDTQVELPGTGAKVSPHRFNSFNGLRRSGSGAIVSGTRARTIDHARFRNRAPRGNRPPRKPAVKSAKTVPVSNFTRWG